MCCEYNFRSDEKCDPAYGGVEPWPQDHIVKGCGVSFKSVCHSFFSSLPLTLSGSTENEKLRRERARERERKAGSKIQILYSTGPVPGYSTVPYKIDPFFENLFITERGIDEVLPSYIAHITTHAKTGPSRGFGRRHAAGSATEACDRCPARIKYI